MQTPTVIPIGRCRWHASHMAAGPCPGCMRAKRLRLEAQNREAAEAAARWAVRSPHHGQAGAGA